MGCNPLLTRKSQVTGKVQNVCTVEATLSAFDAKARHYVGAGAEYDAPREKRDIARRSLTPIGSLESTKAINVSFRGEVNTPDSFVIHADLSSMDVESIEYQSILGDGSIQRVTFNATPDLSGVVSGNYLTLRYSDNSSNDGDFQITSVNAGSYYVDIFNPNRTNAGDDESALSASIGDIQNNLEYGWAIKGCATELKGLTRLSIEAVTGGPFKRSETITGTTSTATARVVIPAKNGDTHIYVEVLTGKLQTGEDLTGGISLAVTTSSSIPSIYGYYAKPISSGQETVTVAYNVDGYEWKAKNAMGTMSGEFEANKSGFLDFAFQGPKNSHGDKALDIVSRDDEEPPILKNAELFLKGANDLNDFFPIFSKVSFEQGNTVALRVNGNATGDSGFEGARVTERAGKITLSLEHELASSFDFFQKLDDGEKVSLGFHLGADSNKQFLFFADELEFESIGNGDLDGIVTIDITSDLTGSGASGDDEWEMVLSLIHI